MHHPGLTTRIEVDLAVVMTGSHHFNSTPLKFFPNEPRQHEGLRGIAMQAQTVNRHRNQSTLDGHDGLIEQQPKLLSHAVLIFDNRSYVASRYQSTIGSVCAIGKSFLDHLQPGRANVDPAKAYNNSEASTSRTPLTMASAISSSRAAIV